MSQINKLFHIEVTPEKFLEACSPEELIEVDLLLNQHRFQEKMGRCSFSQEVSTLDTLKKEILIQNRPKL